ncbi:serine/threonine-protein kinase [Nakamurella sp.]|uniref:serine/threonine-protein kinase n=1 Tax=Nakamurella sp. TaxID=1869182 RepID=UPI0037830C3B
MRPDGGGVMTAPGVTLSHRYRLTHRIAVGGMGEVWAADDIRLARVVACKILRPELTGDPEFLGRFRTEARITASLNHPGICAVYDYGEVSGTDHYLTGTAYLVMELISGESLSSVLNRLGRLSVGRTLDVLEQTGNALQQAHARALVHRDIKPGNLLITPGGQVKITDFGIAKVAHEAPVTRSGMVMGTAQYISPEQAAGREASPASDIYSLGVVAYECLAGRLPFNSDNTVAIALAHVREAPPPLPDDVPPPVARLVMTMLAKDPAARFPNGAVLARAASELRAGGGRDLTPLRPPPAPRPTLVAPAMTTGVAARPQARSTRATARPLPPPAQPAQAVRPSVPPPVPAARSAPTAGRHTGLSVLLAVLVVILAGLVLVILNAVFGTLMV